MATSGRHTEIPKDQADLLARQDAWGSGANIPAHVLESVVRFHEKKLASHPANGAQNQNLASKGHTGKDAWGPGPSVPEDVLENLVEFHKQKLVKQGQSSKQGEATAKPKQTEKPTYPANNEEVDSQSDDEEGDSDSDAGTEMSWSQSPTPERRKTSINGRANQSEASDQRSHPPVSTSQDPTNPDRDSPLSASPSANRMGRDRRSPPPALPSSDRADVNQQRSSPPPRFMGKEPSTDHSDEPEQPSNLPVSAEQNNANILPVTMPTTKTMPKLPEIPSFPSSVASSEADMEMDVPGAIDDGPEPFDRRTLADQFLPTPPSAQLPIIPSTFSEPASAVKPPQPKRRRLLKTPNFSREDNPADRDDAEGGELTELKHKAPSVVTSSKVLEKLPIELSSPVASTAPAVSTATPVQLGPGDTPSVFNSAPSTTLPQLPTNQQLTKPMEARKDDTSQENSSLSEQILPNGPPSQVPFLAFKLAYPEYTSNLDVFLRSVIYVEQLQSRGSLSEFLYDDFVGAFPQYMAYVRQYIATHENNSNACTGIRWYNQNIRRPTFLKGILSRDNLDNVFEKYAKEVEDIRRWQRKRSGTTTPHDESGSEDDSDGDGLAEDDTDDDVDEGEAGNNSMEVDDIEDGDEGQTTPNGAWATTAEPHSDLEMVEGDADKECEISIPMTAPSPPSVKRSFHELPTDPIQSQEEPPKETAQASPRKSTVVTQSQAEASPQGSVDTTTRSKTAKSSEQGPGSLASNSSPEMLRSQISPPRFRRSTLDRSSPGLMSQLPSAPIERGRTMARTMDRGRAIANEYILRGPTEHGGTMAKPADRGGTVTQEEHLSTYSISTKLQIVPAAQLADHGGAPIQSTPSNAISSSLSQMMAAGTIPETTIKPKIPARSLMGPPLKGSPYGSSAMTAAPRKETPEEREQRFRLFIREQKLKQQEAAAKQQDKKGADDASTTK